MSISPNRGFVWGIAACFLVLAVGAVFLAGLANTPYQTVDSAGHAMGFNGSFSAEHYGIAFRNFTFAALLKQMSPYDWLLLLMQIIGASLLLRTAWSTRRFTRRFFACQLFLFPLGWLGFLYLPMLAWDLFRDGLDRESFIDIPFLWLTAQPVWIAFSVFTAARITGESLGIKTAGESVLAGWGRGWRLVMARLG